MFSCRTDAQIATAQENLIEYGYNRWVAEALANNDYDTKAIYDISTDSTGMELIQYLNGDGAFLEASLSADSAFEHALTWHGIVGYAGTIRDALDNCRNMEAV